MVESSKFNRLGFTESLTQIILSIAIAFLELLSYYSVKPYNIGVRKMELLINAVLVLIGVGVMVYVSAGIILMDCRERREKKEAEANRKATLERLRAKLGK